MASRVSSVVVGVGDHQPHTIDASGHWHRRVTLQCDGTCWLYFDPAEAVGNFASGGWFLQDSTGLTPLVFECHEPFYLYSFSADGAAVTVRLLIEEWDVGNDGA